MMLFLIDEQFSRKLVVWFKSKGHDAVHVEDVLGAGSGDSAIVRYARSRQAIIVSKDADFRDLLAAAANAPPVIWVRAGNATTRMMTMLLETEWPRVLDALARDEPVVELG